MRNKKNPTLIFAFMLLVVMLMSACSEPVVDAHYGKNLWHPEDTNFIFNGNGITIQYDDKTEIYTIDGVVDKDFELSLASGLEPIFASNTRYTLTSYWVGGAIESPAVDGLGVMVNVSGADNAVINSLFVRITGDSYNKNAINTTLFTKEDVKKSASMDYALKFYKGVAYKRYQFRIQFEYGEGTDWKTYSGDPIVNPNLWVLGDVAFPMEENGVVIDYDPEDQIFTINGAVPEDMAFRVAARISFPMHADQSYTISNYYKGGTVTGDSPNALFSFVDAIKLGKLSFNIVATTSIPEHDVNVVRNTIVLTEEQAADIEYLRTGFFLFAGSVFDNYQIQVKFEAGKGSAWVPSVQSAVEILPEPTNPNLWGIDNMEFSEEKNGVALDYDPETQIFTINGAVSEDQSFQLIRNMPSFLQAGQAYTMTLYYIDGTVDGETENALFPFVDSIKDGKFSFNISSIVKTEDYSGQTLRTVVLTEDQAADIEYLRTGFFLFGGNTFDNYRCKVKFEAGEKTNWTPYEALEAVEAPIDVD